MANFLAVNLQLLSPNASSEKYARSNEAVKFPFMKKCLVRVAPSPKTSQLFPCGGSAHSQERVPLRAAMSNVLHVSSLFHFAQLC